MVVSLASNYSTWRVVRCIVYGTYMYTTMAEVTAAAAHSAAPYCCTPIRVDAIDGRVRYLNAMHSWRETPEIAQAMA